MASTFKRWGDQWLKYGRVAAWFANFLVTESGGSLLCQGILQLGEVVGSASTKPTGASGFWSAKRRRCQIGVFLAAENLHRFSAQAHEINGQILGMKPDAPFPPNLRRKRKGVVHHTPPDLGKECMVNHPGKSADPRLQKLSGPIVRLRATAQHRFLTSSPS